MALVGAVAGAAYDRRVVPAPQRRGPWWVLEADLHAHTRFSDGFLGPADLVMHAERSGLHVLAVTEHNLVFPGLMASAWARATSPVVVLPSEEITASGYHVHAVNIRSRVLPRHDLASVIAAVHAQGGLVIAAHPVRAFWPALVPVRPWLDGAEVYHPLALGAEGTGRRWAEMLAFYDDAARDGRRLTAVGASDYHFFAPLGVCRTLVFARAWSREAAVEALAAGRTVVVDHLGHRWGDPAMMALLDAAPPAPAHASPGYQARSGLDAATRLMGLLGLLGLVLFRRR